MLDMRQWQGDEAVLEVGTGRRVIMDKTARRVPLGKVWSIGSRNNPGPASQLPYPDNTFDVVMSISAIHVIPTIASGRAQAIAEMWRVLRPGGQILLFDIRYTRAHLRQLRALGGRQSFALDRVRLWGSVGRYFAVTKDG